MSPPAAVAGPLERRRPRMAPARREPVRFLAPELPALTEIAQYYALSEEAAFYSNGGPCARLLAERLAEHLGGGVTVVPVANCTLGLMTALRAVCGEPSARRSRIAVPSFTFTATACAIVWAGFEPVFVDIEPASWQMDADALRRALAGPATRMAGVLGCSTFGTAPPAALRAEWRAACTDAGVPLLLDSAGGFGAVDSAGGRVGALGETEAFSFHATKPFAIGEGGALITPDPAVAARAERLINFGMERGGRSSAVPGLNAKLSELHAATALAMLDRYPEALARRRASAARLHDALAAAGARVGFQEGVAGSTWQVCQVTTATAADRDAVLAAAERDGVQARAYFDPPVHRQPAFARWAPAAGLPVTDDVAARSLSLPMANDLAAGDVERIAAVAAVGSLEAAA
jgi:dTDP-4-amino-4,6-dideoxygalactose transaminase